MAGARARKRGIHRFRRPLQLSFLVVFFALLTYTVWPLGQVFLGAYLVADPLIALNSIANGVWLAPMLLALAMLVAPLVLGRAFCGYVCPMGTVIELTGPAPTRGPSIPERVRGPLAKTPLFVLIASIGSMFFSVAVFLIFDPLSLLTRSATMLLYPLIDRLLRLAGDVLYLVPAFRGAVDTATTALGGRLVFPEPLHYGMQLGILALFAVVLLLSLAETRLWCRHLCPLGALLGFMGRFALVGRVVDEDRCVHCGKCESVCPLDAVGSDHVTTDTSRCQLGLECADACPEDAIGVGAWPGKDLYHPGRRAFLGATGATLAAGFFAYSGLAGRAASAAPVRPPGSREESRFLALCSRCGQCMKVCPTNVLQPALFEAAWEGFLTPRMDFRVGYCDWACNECGKVCPTGAIEALTLPVKREMVLGRAHIDTDRCIPWADSETCLVCEELCPVPDKAIRLRPDDADPRLLLPEVHGRHCIGCGICEYHCPVAGEPAIVISQAEDGEGSGGRRRGRQGGAHGA